MPKGYLFKNADVYAPAHIGMKDMLVVGNRILTVDSHIDASFAGLETVDLEGRIVTPGLIDQHIHVTGGGGEGGTVTRAPEMNFSELVTGGITTFVGVSGTDSETRPIEALMAKVRALVQEGASGWMWTSNYRYPVTTVTGSVRKDLLTIPECLGVKIAMGDHRCSFPTDQEILRLLSEIRVGGMICGHDSFLHVHLGDLPIAFPTFMHCVRTGMPIKHIRPTHVGRHPEVFAQAIQFTKDGGYIDITTSGGNYKGSAADMYLLATEEGADLERITMSSDAHGSMPRFDEKGEMIGLTVCSVDSNLLALRELSGLIGLEKALKPMTTVIANALGLKQKGRIEDGMDADFLVFDQDMNLMDVYMKGRQTMREGKVIVKGTFEI